MTSDEELEKLALEYYNARTNEDFGYPVGDFKAGFRAAEKIMAEKWPSEDEIDKAAEYFARGDYDEGQRDFREGVDWLKQKLFQS
jgi:hypothetical protein